MQRVTITIDQELLKQLDQFMTEKNYDNRSEAIRDMVRDRLEGERLENQDQDGTCVATLSYVYNHEERELAKRLAHVHHGHHDLSHATMHVHLDKDTCLEAAILKGGTKQVKDVANRIIAERGVRHGMVHLIPVDLPLHQDVHKETTAHKHDHEHTHEHKHIHDHEHTHSHDHWHTHKDGTYHTHSHIHTHAHPHEHVHQHEHQHTHSHDHKGNDHQHDHDGDHSHDFRAHDHDHIGQDHGEHSHDHPGHEAELHDDHKH